MQEDPSVLGSDIAKPVLHVMGVDTTGKVLVRKPPLNVVYGVATCVNLLQNRKQWQLISATGGPMVLGYARVSKGKE